MSNSFEQLQWDDKNEKIFSMYRVYKTAQMDDCIKRYKIYGVYNTAQLGKWMNGKICSCLFKKSYPCIFIKFTNMIIKLVNVFD